MEEQYVEVPVEGTSQPEAEGQIPETETPPEPPKYYTPEESSGLTPTDIDLARVDPSVKPIVENTIRDYKKLQADHTRKSQELAELKKVPVPEEKFFDDYRKDTFFKDYLKNPLKGIAYINSQISQLEGVIPDDGAEQYREARKTIAQWVSIKDEFQEKRNELSNLRRQEEVAEAKLIAELGKEAPDLLEHAKELGYSERDFKSNPKLREALKRTFQLSHAAEFAQGKEKKPIPHKAATPSGGASGSGETKEPTFKTDDEWYAHQRQQKREALKRRLGG
jgi:hypothetical protein